MFHDNFGNKIEKVNHPIKDVEIGRFKLVVLSEFSEAAFSRVCKTLDSLC
jgi:hypothetical protein